MQLYYYDDITVSFDYTIHSQPPDYQPKYFEDTANVAIKPGDSSFCSDPFIIEAGKLKTVFLTLLTLIQPFHSMCMKVRVTENTIQSNHSMQEEGSEQINQTSFSTNPIHQLTSELQELLMFTCQQKRINYSVLIIDLIITKNLLSKYNCKTMELAKQLDQLCIVFYIVFIVDELGYVNKIKNHYTLTHRSLHFFNSFLQKLLIGIISI